MVDVKLANLITDFSPGRIVMRIELVPVNGFEFDLPIDEAGNKLSQVANYARTTFGIRTSNIEPQKPQDEGLRQPNRKVSDRADRKKREIAKTLEKGSDRALQVMQGELDRAIKEKDDSEIKRAREQLDRAKAMYEANKAERG